MLYKLLIIFQSSKKIKNRVLLGLKLKTNLIIMEQKMINLWLFTLTLVGLCSCTEKDNQITVPSDLSLDIEIVGQSGDEPHGDGSGEVKFIARANNAVSYEFELNQDTILNSSSGEVTHIFKDSGVNDYQVVLRAFGAEGQSIKTTSVFTVLSRFNGLQIRNLITGGSSKTWYIAAAIPAHLGVGPAIGDGMDTPGYYAATPFEKAGDYISACFYSSELVFSLEGQDITYELKNNGSTFFHADYAPQYGGEAGQDQCLDYNPGAAKTVKFSPAISGIPYGQSTGVEINISDDGFMGYYTGTSQYEVLTIDQTSMHVRSIMRSDPSLAWYLKFTTIPPEKMPDEAFETQYTDLIWEQNFDEPLDTELWNFELGNNDGWGNQELQYYTKDNAVVDNGNLVITLRAEPTNGFDYSSSRITTQNNFQFKYGRVEARAKLPHGHGTWPAIWMLGSNFTEEGWPKSGEIDIMEHVGNQQNTIHGTLHYPGRSGGNADGGSIEIENASSEFHTYSMEWSEQRIVFLVDGKVYHTYQNTPGSSFHHDFFLIMNVAMGGSFGGMVSPDFQSSSMQVDYIKVYQ